MSLATRAGASMTTGEEMRPSNVRDCNGSRSEGRGVGGRGGAAGGVGVRTGKAVGTGMAGRRRKRSGESGGQEQQGLRCGCLSVGLGW